MPNQLFYNTGIATYYGSHKGLLELTSEGAMAIYGDKRIPLPTRNDEREDYLRAVIEVDSNNDQLKQRLARMLAPPVEVPVNTTDGENAVSTEEGGEVAVKPIPLPGTCQ